MTKNPGLQNSMATISLNMEKWENFLKFSSKGQHSYKIVSWVNYSLGVKWPRCASHWSLSLLLFFMGHCPHFLYSFLYPFLFTLPFLLSIVKYANTTQIWNYWSRQKLRHWPLKSLNIVPSSRK